jgi:hypothetical protein
MASEGPNRREQTRRILPTFSVIPLALLGAGLTLGGCCIGGPWLVALIVWWPPPDPMILVYGIALLLMLPVGILLLVIALALRRALTGTRRR